MSQHFQLKFQLYIKSLLSPQKRFGSLNFKLYICIMNITPRVKEYIDQQVQEKGKNAVVTESINSYDDAKGYPDLRQTCLDILEYLGYEQAPSGGFWLK